MHLIDLTRTVSDGMPVFPGDSPVSLRPFATIEEEGFTNFRLECGMHIGTHMDGPLHMISGGRRLLDMSPEYFAGRGVMVDARGHDPIDTEVLASRQLQRGDILVIRTGWSAHYGTIRYYEDYPELTTQLAAAIIEAGVKMVCLDSPSPDKSPFRIHHLLLGNDILIVENLVGLEALAEVVRFDMFAFPLKLEADSAPARVMAQVHVG